MIHKQLATGQPDPDLASTQRASPSRGKLTPPWFTGLLVSVLVAALILPVLPVLAEPTITTPAPKLILLSASSNGEIKYGPLRLKFSDEDIVAYDPALDTWTMYFDGSAHGLGSADLEDFEILTDGDILFTLDKNLTLPNKCGGGSLSVKDFDVVRFDASADCYTIYLAGSTLNLTKGDEDIDALACTTPVCDVLLISTIGTVQADAGGGTEVKAEDEDLLECNVAATTCQLDADEGFNGTNLALTSGDEDIDAAWKNYDNGNLWLTTKGKFTASSINSLNGDNNDVFGCAPPTPGVFGTGTSCFLYEVFNAEARGFKKAIDGLWATFDTPPPLPLVAAQAAASQADEAVEPDDPIDAADFAEAMSMGNPEVDAYDFIDVVQQIYLPVVNR
jgi:hypothetical protein